MDEVINYLCYCLSLGECSIAYCFDSDVLITTVLNIDTINVITDIVTFAIAMTKYVVHAVFFLLL